jgi:hypothetical protein
MQDMCRTITEFAPLVVSCLESVNPMCARAVYGQFVRCAFAKKVLGDDWATEKAEDCLFVNVSTNETMTPVDFIRVGFADMI